jgi:tetratricopeptide (TPR) repeat protein
MTIAHDPAIPGAAPEPPAAAGPGLDTAARAERVAASVSGVTLGRRLATFRAAHERPREHDVPTAAGSSEDDLASRLAAAVHGEVVSSRAGRIVRVDAGTLELPLDRERLAWIPGQPGPDRPFVCLDTETTGLGTGAGTVAFLVGVARWEAGVLRLVQLLLPDHGDEAALLDAVAAEIGPAPALVTYNGRTFDWPLLVARYRIHGRAAPALAAHVDLLTIVRRLFRHRLGRARLRSAEEGLLALRRHDDVEGWEIPDLYHAFLRGASAEPLARVVRHNAEDVRSLARLLEYLDRRLADPDARPAAHPGDLASLAGLLRAHGRHDESLACLDQAIAAVRDVGGIVSAWSPPALSPMWPSRQPEDGGAKHEHAVGLRPGLDPATGPGPGVEIDDDRWWSPRTRPTYGGRPIALESARAIGPGIVDSVEPARLGPLLAARARTLRRLGRVDDACAAWEEAALVAGPEGAAAWVEAAKILEHARRDPAGALGATDRALALLARRRALGRPDPRAESLLASRRLRLLRRIERTARVSGAAGTSRRSPRAQARMPA